MQNQGNCYKNVWILSGTSDGPVIANRLLELNYSVFASVLTYKAGQAYIENSKLHICLLYTSPSPRDLSTSRMPSSA